ncbi:MAG: D-alanine--D-alanine ligase [Candidatus Stahlbacteria bacterium]|nr:D-alanine--D-alanine ligase [Candidatus Stahlbacteria bacterium]
MELKNKIIGVLMGGWSTERKISLKSGTKVANSLRHQGFKVVEIDIGHNPVEMRANLVSLNKIDIAFIALHGVPGEDGTIQGMMEIMGIPYTGSGVMASAICMNKIITKKLLIINNIKVPKYVKPTRPDAECIGKTPNPKPQTPNPKDVLGSPPWVVKAVNGGSSLGVKIVKKEKDLKPTFNELKKEYGELFIEEFIPGIEVTVGILGNMALPVAELVPGSEFFDYYAKYTPGVTQEIIPARLPDTVYKKVQKIGLQSHIAVGCKGISRVDMIVNNTDIYVLEINSIPGLTDMSVLPMEAANIGISYDEVVFKILVAI